MISFDSFLLRHPSHPSQDPSGTGVDTDTFEEQDLEGEKYIRCRDCGNPLTHPSERISIDGSHAHTFANPSGIIYEIGCFRTVIGCGYVGPATDEFSWFRGYSWKVAYCVGCLNHLGWLFLSPSNDPFHGLILDKLTDPE